MSSKIIFLNSSLNINNITGIEAASCFRSKVFESQLNLDIYFYTVNYSNRTYEHFSMLKDQGKIAKSAALANLYTYYQERVENPFVSENSINKIDFLNKKWSIVEKPGTNDLRIYNEKNEKTLYVHRDTTGKISFINTMITSNRVQNIQREWYDENGVLSKTEIFDLSNDKVIMEIFYRVDGTICIVKHYQNENNIQKLKHINLYNKKGYIIQFFDNELDFIAHWINEMITCKEKYILIMERSANYYEALKKVNHTNVYKIGIIHASHLVYGVTHLNQSPLEIPLNSAYQHMLEDLNNHDYLDRVIVFSKRQLKDIEIRFGNSKKLTCIPNLLNKAIEKVGFSNRNLNNIIMIARYAPVKQHKSAVRMMKYVVEKNPNIILEMYGNGPEKTNIENYIKEFGLENNIKVYSYINNPTNVYNKSAVCILTSLSEGFSLTILEALSHGVPCIAYNIRYGPDSMIQSGVNGYLIKPNNEKEMASRVLDLITNNNKLLEFSNEAYKVNEEFSIEKIVGLWSDMLKNMDSNILN